MKDISLNADSCSDTNSTETWLLKVGQSQVYSVLIQTNRNHNSLNSKSEYNRSALPRLGLKMGDQEQFGAIQIALYISK